MRMYHEKYEVRNEWQALQAVITQVFASVWKNVKDTVKPYKINRHALRDLFAQPYYGVRNILLGVAVGSASILRSLINSFICLPFLLASPFSQVARNLLKSLIKDQIRPSVFGVAASIVCLVRGVTQIAAWPLTILRAPLRVIITLVKGKPKIEDNQGLRALVKKYDAAAKEKDPTKRNIMHIILLKFDKAITRGQKMASDMASYTDDSKNFIRVFEARPSKPKDKEAYYEKKASRHARHINFFKQVIEKRDVEFQQKKAAVKGASR